MTAPAQGEKKSLLSRFSKSSAGYSASMLAASNVAAMALRLVGGVILVKLLTPTELGTINAIGLVLVYAGFLQLGTVNGLNRELPFLLGKGDREQALELASCAFTWAIFCGVLTSLVAGVWAVWEAFQGRWAFAEGWGAHVLILLLFFPNLYLKATFRTSSEFVKLGVSQLLATVTAFVFLLLVWKTGYVGQCIRLVMVVAAEGLLLWRWRPIRVKPTFNWRRFRHLLKIGVPIFGTSYLYLAWRNMDRMLIVRALGTEQLGFYQLAVLTVTAGLSVTLAVSQVVYPRMTLMYGRTGDGRAALKWSWRPTVFLIIASVPALGAGVFAIGPLVRWLLPKYSPGIPAAQWSMLTLLFMCFLPPLNIYSVLRKQLVYAVVIGVGFGIFMAAIPLFQLFASHPLVPYAQAMALAMAVFVALGNVVAFYITRGRRESSGVTGEPGTTDPPPEQ